MDVPLPQTGDLAKKAEFAAFRSAINALEEEKAQCAAGEGEDLADAFAFIEEQRTEELEREAELWRVRCTAIEERFKAQRAHLDHEFPGKATGDDQALIEELFTATVLAYVHQETRLARAIAQRMTSDEWERHQQAFGQIDFPRCPLRARAPLPSPTAPILTRKQAEDDVGALMNLIPR